MSTSPTQVEHIRRRPRPSDGTQPTGAEKTLCGAPPTAGDRSWAGTLFVSTRDEMTCQACADLLANG